MEETLPDKCAEILHCIDCDEFEHCKYWELNYWE